MPLGISSLGFAKRARFAENYLSWLLCLRILPVLVGFQAKPKGKPRLMFFGGGAGDPVSPKKKDTNMRLGFPLSDSWMVLTRGLGKECDIQTEPLRGLVQPLTKRTRKHLGEFQDSGQSKMGYSKTTPPPPPPKKKIREKIRDKKKEEQTNKTRHLFANQLSL